MGQFAGDVHDNGNVVGDDLCSPMCTKPKLVFLTSIPFLGNLGGLAGGDGKCQTLANAANLGGTYRAWISDKTQNPQNRFVKPNSGYARVDGKDVATSWSDLVNGSILAPININEKKAMVGQVNVWTGTASNGTSTGVDCAGWLVPAGFPGSEGRNNATDSNWTNTGPNNGSVCSDSQHLYCFQQ